MKSAYEYLTESPIAVYDDWEGHKIKLGAMRYKAFEKYWDSLTPISDTNPLEAYIIVEGNSGRVVYGKHIGDDFGIYVEMTIVPRKDSSRIKPNTIIISGVKTDKKFRFSGYATELYRILLANGYTIMSDQTQYNGARQLYQKLYDSKEYDFFLWDEHLFKIVDDDLVLKHGKDDWSWSHTNKIIIRKK